ncbi:MAG: hypothetical protein K2J26_01345 [Ruminococcus sp.]|nr:hypothetical protein [Ruminococcus sp.]
MNKNELVDNDKIIDTVIKEDVSKLVKQMRKVQIQRTIVSAVFIIVIILLFVIIAMNCIMQISDFLKNNSFDDIIDVLKIIGIFSGISAVFYGFFHLLKKKNKAFYNQSELSLIGFSLCCVTGLWILVSGGFIIFSELRD